MNSLRLFSNFNVSLFMDCSIGPYDVPRSQRPLTKFAELSVTALYGSQRQGSERRGTRSRRDRSVSGVASEPGPSD